MMTDQNALNFGPWSSGTEYKERQVFYHGCHVGKITRVAVKPSDEWLVDEYEVTFFPPRLDKSKSFMTDDFKTAQQSWSATRKYVREILGS